MPIINLNTSVNPRETHANIVATLTTTIYIHLPVLILVLEVICLSCIFMYIILGMAFFVMPR